MFKNLKFFLGVVLVMLILTGCGKEKTVLEFKPDGNMIAYTQKSYTVKANQPFVIQLNNVATVPVMVHNVVLLKPGTDVASIGIKAQSESDYLPDDPNIISATALAKPGEVVSVEVKGLEPGKYPFVCTYPGHYMMMQGVLIVE